MESNALTASIGRTHQQLLGDCLRLLTHDMNNPLTAIRLLAETLRDEVGTAEMRQDVLDILEAADMSSALMEGLSALVRMEREDEDYTWFPINLVGILRSAVDRPALRRQIKLTLPQELQMRGDEAGLRRAFTDVLINARRLVDHKRQVTVTARELDQGVLELRVHHPGAGIPHALRARLFEPFGSVELRQNRVPVLATGLAYARTVIEHHEGAMAFEDAHDGTDLAIRFRR
ncbi:MAG: HAMP domain-containing histidine kinase [Alphaproteobacteria bacterium]|nr:HAMP domain-containing histidine kinase [Alphaproteobacteria bacterium]MCB9696403.1 HAMP domain-containing histidine kinase [Alphaproteobacteria bacterium]